MADEAVVVELPRVLREGLATSVLNSFDGEQRDDWLLKLLLDAPAERLKRLPPALLTKLGRAQQLEL